MVELIFVIVIIGILSAIALPKLAATRDDATVTKAIATVGSVRSALATERQKRILRGNFVAITSLHSTNCTNSAFSTFSDDGTGIKDKVLAYTVSSCSSQGKTQGCWDVSTAGTYRYKMPTSGFVDFSITKNHFTCTVPTDANCKLLTQ